MINCNFYYYELFFVISIILSYVLTRIIRVCSTVFRKVYITFSNYNNLKVYITFGNYNHFITLFILTFGNYSDVAIFIQLKGE